MANPVDSQIINRETNARFWAQTNYRPNEKLDPKNPLDAKQIPVWLDIQKKVKREAAAGKLVTTFDHPVVAQNLSDANVATAAAAALLAAAAKAIDPAIAHQHVAAATTASQIAAQKTQEAAALQPKTVSPKLAQEAALAVARTPPPPHAPPADHLAHAQAQPTRPPIPSRDVLVKMTNELFWASTHYKPGQKLDMSIPMDRQMAQTWMEIFGKVQAEAAAGTLALTYPSMPPMGPPVPSMPPMRPAPMRPAPMRPAPMPPRRPLMGPLPPVPPMGLPVPTMPLAAPPGVPTVPSEPPPSPTPEKEKPTPEEEKPTWSAGKIIAIAAAVAAAGGLAYVATRKPSRSPSPRAPKVFVATPATPARVVRTPSMPARTARTSSARALRS